MVQSLRKSALREALGWSCAFLACAALWIFFAFLSEMPFDGDDIGFMLSNACFSLLTFVGAWICWRDLLRKKYMQSLNAFVNQANNPEEMMRRIEHAWNNAIVIAQRCRMDGEFFIYGDGEVFVLIPWQDVQEVHTDLRPSKKRGSIVLITRFIMKDGKAKAFHIFTSSRRAGIEKVYAVEKDMLNMLATWHPDILRRPRTGDL